MPTTWAITTRTYVREKYAHGLRVRRSRLGAWRAGQYELKERDRITVVLTRWLHRCARDQAVVMGVSVVTVERWWEERPVLLAVVNAYTDVQPRDRDTLASMVDHPRGYTVRVPLPFLMDLEEADRGPDR